MSAPPLQDEHEKLLQFLYQCPVGLAAVSPDGEIRLLNAVGAQLLMPIAGGEMENLWTIFGPFDSGLAGLAAAKPAPGRPPCEKRRIFVPPEGCRPAVWLSMDIIRLGEDSLQACFFDITQTVDAETRERAALQIQAQQEGKIEIITNVLHDIGNAVTGIGTRAARLAAEEEWPEVRRGRQLGDFVRAELPRLEAAVGEAKSGALLAFASALADTIARRFDEARENAGFFTRTVSHIQEILNVQRGLVAHGRGSCPVAIAPAELVSDALAIQREGLLKREIRARIVAPPDLPEICGDRTRLLQVLINLIKNAAEALELSPRDRAREIAIRADVVKSGGGDVLEIAVADNGPGFSAGRAEEFFRRGRTEKAQGSGFGLSHARSIAESHRGSLRLQSDGPGLGCTATIALPVTHP